jgi:CubicO group peptidase (beta-lactamase class C family)
MKRVALAASLAVAVSACGPGPGPRPAAPTAPPPAPPPTRLPLLDEPGALAAWVDRELATTPSAVVAIYDRTGMRWSHGRGARDARGGAPPDRTTRYRIGSITKLVTATAALRLVAAGRLSLDEPVGRWLPELARALPGVTVRHLVTHTAGVPSIGDGSAPYWTGAPGPTEAAFLAALGGPTEFAPGARYAYSNAGMALVGLIAARVSGQPWRAFVDDQVLAPLGLGGARWDLAAVAPDERAVGVAPDGTVDPPSWQLGAFEPAGGLVVNADELSGLVGLALGAHPEVLAPADLATALTDDLLPGPHGIGWLIATVDGDRLVGHTGSTTDYAASLMIRPGAEVGVAVLTAGGDAGLADCVAVALVRAATASAAPARCRPDDLDAAARARYQTAADRVVALVNAATVDDDDLAATFAPSFLATTPVAELRAALAAVAAQLGPCTAATVGAATTRGVEITLACAKAPFALVGAVEDAASSRFLRLDPR